MNYSNSQRAGVILNFTAVLFGGYEQLEKEISNEILSEITSEFGPKINVHDYVEVSTYQRLESKIKENIINTSEKLQRYSCVICCYPAFYLPLNHVIFS